MKITKIWKIEFDKKTLYGEQVNRLTQMLSDPDTRPSYLAISKKGMGEALAEHLVNQEMKGCWKIRRHGLSMTKDDAVLQSLR